MRFNSTDPPSSPRPRQELLDGIYRRGRELRRRRQAMMGGALAVVLALVVAVPALGFLTSDDDSDDVATGPGSSTSTTTESSTTSTTTPTTSVLPTTPSTTESTTTSTTTTTAPPPQRPAVAVAVTRDNRLVVVDTATGEIVRTLHEEPAKEDRDVTIVSPSLAADGSVYFSVFRSDCRSPIYRVPLTGGSLQQVAEGFAPAVSPDGLRLAYAADEPRGPESFDGCTTTITVRDLSTGAERSWPYRTGVDPTVEFDWTQAAVSQISWAPDSDRIAFDLGFEGSWVSVLDTSREGTIQDAAVVMKVSGFDGFMSSPAWMSGEEIALNLTSANVYYSDADVDNEQIAAVAATGGPARTLSRPTGDGSALDLAADSSGRFLIWVALDGGFGMVDAVTGEQSVLGGAYDEVDW